MCRHVAPLGFLRDAVAEALSSSEALSLCESFMEFEGAVHEALREGASAGTSALPTRLDAARPAQRPSRRLARMSTIP